MFAATGVSQKGLVEQGRKIVRKDGKQILLISCEGRVFAIANRCPHEGYPLSEGTEGPGCVLTCNWHNWKFDLATGAALTGRDPVRTYPVEVRNGEIFVDFSDPPADVQRERALNGLSAAIADGDDARMAREVARLERAGFDARVAVTHAFRVGNDRLENGMTHAHAAAADWLALAERAPSPDAHLAAMLEPISHLSWDIMGAGRFAYAAETLRWNAGAFLAAMEAEDEEKAVGYIRGAIADNVPYRELRKSLGRAALAHYADFGHSAIYTFKSGQLIERLGADVAEPVLLALTRSLVQARREERLPEFRSYSAAIASWANGGRRPIEASDLYGLNVERILRRVMESALRPPSELFDALLGVCAWNMLHFDLRIDRAADNAIADNVNWLDFTHALTFANAVRQLSEDVPELWKSALLQLALFAGRNAGYVDKDQDVGRWNAGDANVFIAQAMAGLYDPSIVEPIVLCHRLKVLFALEEEIRVAPDAPWLGTMCAAVNRYLNSPMKRRHALRLATQARDFIAREG